MSKIIIIALLCASVFFAHAQAENGGAVSVHYKNIFHTHGIEFLHWQNV